MSSQYILKIERVKDNQFQTDEEVI